MKSIHEYPVNIRDVTVLHLPKNSVFLNLINKNGSLFM
jgi:hypothetical protein